jgi:hypothetical protein
MKLIRLEYDENGKPYLVRGGIKLERELKANNEDLPRMANKLKAASYGYYFGAH